MRKLIGAGLLLATAACSGATPHKAAKSACPSGDVAALQKVFPAGHWSVTSAVQPGGACALTAVSGADGTLVVTTKPSLDPTATVTAYVAGLPAALKPVKDLGVGAASGGVASEGDGHVGLLLEGATASAVVAVDGKVATSLTGSRSGEQVAHDVLAWAVAPR